MSGRMNKYLAALLLGLGLLILQSVASAEKRYLDGKITNAVNTTGGSRIIVNRGFVKGVFVNAKGYLVDKSGNKVKDSDFVVDKVTIQEAKAFLKGWTIDMVQASTHQVKMQYDTKELPKPNQYKEAKVTKAVTSGSGLSITLNRGSADEVFTKAEGYFVNDNGKRVEGTEFYIQSVSTTESVGYISGWTYDSLKPYFANVRIQWDKRIAEKEQGK